MIVGQHTRLSTIQTFEMIRPRWKSLGYATALLLFITLTYYGVIVGYTLYYIVGSCQNPLPWEAVGASNYWFHNVLNQYDDLNTKPAGLGPIQWHLFGALIAFWVIVLLSVSLGHKILSKVTYVTVILPVILMLILVIRSSFLEGAGEGISFYIGRFDASKLGDVTVWATACGQILFSLSPGFGTAITYSSMTDKKGDVYKIAIITAVTNSAFSIVGGIGIFAIIGHLAYLEGESVEVIGSRSGTGLAFITIAEAMTKFGAAKNAMSVMFFFMLFSLGLDSAFALLETLASYVQDYIKERGFARRPTWQVTTGLATILTLLGMPFCTRAGGELLDVVDHFAGTVLLLVICFVESIMFNFDFGWRRLAYALKKATIGNKGTPNGRDLFPKFLCRLDFHVTVPLLTGALFLYLFVSDILKPYSGYPTGFVAFGWTLFAVLVSIIPLTLWKRDAGTLPPVDFDKEVREDDEEEQAGSDAGVDAENGESQWEGKDAQGDSTSESSSHVSL